MTLLSNSKTALIHSLRAFSLSMLATLALAETAHDHSNEQEHEEGHIELSTEQIKHAEIGLSRVSSGNIRASLAVYGTVTSNAESIQQVSARFNGVIRSVNKKIGDQVIKGETLLTVEANDSLKTYPIVASLNGVITQRRANIGEQTADRVLYVIEDFSTVWVDLSLFPKDLAKVKTGQTARISSVNHSRISEGKIIYIAPRGNSHNQATVARALLDNSHQQWQPGLFVSAEITLSESTTPTVIRSEAVQRVEGETVVFVQAETGFEPRIITLGRSDGELSEVLAGLNIDEMYVTKNSFVLKSERGKEDAEHGH
jgi:cobalt-zinc-cadmium efflux system membrane fusion protein